MKGIVYQIEINNYKYIGSTHNLCERFYHHCILLTKNKHYNKFIQRVYNKYKSISIDILFEFESREEAYKKEQELLIEFYKKPFYMMCHPKAIGGSLPGKDHPSYGKKRPKHSEWMKIHRIGQYHRTETLKQSLREKNLNKVVCKDLQGKKYVVDRLEFNSRNDLFGVTANIDQLKLRKKVMCIEDNLIFNSIKEASIFYKNIGSSNIIKNMKYSQLLGEKKLGRNINFKYL